MLPYYQMGCSDKQIQERWRMDFPAPVVLAAAGTEASEPADTVAAVLAGSLLEPAALEAADTAA